MEQNQRTIGRLPALLLCAALIAGGACAKKQQLAKNAGDAIPEGGWDDEVASEELDIRNKRFAPSKELATVRFELDSHELTADSRKALFTNAEYLQKHPEVKVLVEGHCDQRGTVGYNLALGQLRAAAVRRYYMSSGVHPSRVGAISYGKERALCQENREPCWSENRRAESKAMIVEVAGQEAGEMENQE